MKNKFNAGDTVIYIYRNDQYKQYEVSSEIIENVVFSKDSLHYWLENGGAEIQEKDLYTKEEAIKFLKEVL